MLKLRALRIKPILLPFPFVYLLLESCLLINNNNNDNVFNHLTSGFIRTKKGRVVFSVTYVIYANIPLFFPI